MEKEKIKKAVKITGPQIQEASLTVPDGSIEDLMSQARDAEEELTGLRVKGIQAADCDFSKIRLRSIVFENCRFFGCRFTGSSLVDLQIRACDFSNCDFSGAYFSRCRMESARSSRRRCGRIWLRLLPVPLPRTAIRFPINIWVSFQ